jgi:hypothetical protein
MTILPIAGLRLPACLVEIFIVILRIFAMR